MPTKQTLNVSSSASLDSDDFETDENGLITFKLSSTKNPGNWPFRKKMFHTVLYGLVTFAAQFNSTSMSSARVPELLKQDFGIPREISLLSSTLYILGIAIGPMVFAPLSEVFGRKPGVLIPFLLSSVFTFAVATCYNVPSLMIYRFLAGFFSGAPIVSAGGVLSDIFPNPSIRGKYFALYAVFVSLGPSSGPTIASLLMYSSDDVGAWRIGQYFSGLMNLILYLSCEFTLSETFQPVVLSREVRTLRSQGSNWNLHCSYDNWSLDFREIVQIHLVRPFAMLFTPIVFTIVLFASYCYGIFYIIITTTSEAFTLTRGWEGTVATLPNLSLFFGVVLGCFINMKWASKYGEVIAQNDGKLIPEERFPIVMYVGWLMPMGIFIFAWTSSETIHWFVPCIGIFCIGISFITIFQGCLNYLVDTYTKYSASVIAANTFLRSLFAASFPLFSKQLFVNLGVHWGASLIGFIALGMIPIPFFFYRYGSIIRRKNPYKGV